MSETETSVVFSLRGHKKIDLNNLIKKHGIEFDSFKIDKIENFNLKSSNLRKYYHKNILAFGDLLHKLHPLAGQGFNMTIRDIKELVRIITNKLELGFSLDDTVCAEFEKNTKYKNFIFSNGIDFIYEFFNLESKFKSQF